MNSLRNPTLSSLIRVSCISFSILSSFKKETRGTKIPSDRSVGRPSIQACAPPGRSDWLFSWTSISSAADACAAATVAAACTHGGQRMCPHRQPVIRRNFLATYGQVQILHTARRSSYFLALAFVVSLFPFILACVAGLDRGGSRTTTMTGDGRCCRYSYRYQVQLATRYPNLHNDRYSQQASD